MSNHRIKFKVSKDYRKFRADNILVRNHEDGTITIDFSEDVLPFPEIIEFENGDLVNITRPEYDELRIMHTAVNMPIMGVPHMIERLQAAYNAYMESLKGDEVDDQS